MAETKRRLPLWMLKQKTETKALGSDANLKSDIQIKEKHVKRTKKKRASEEKSEDQNEEEPVKRKQRRKTSNQDPDEFDEAEVAPHSRAMRKYEIEIEEGRKGSAKGFKRKRNQKKMLVISDDETDLTVDDLVSIAEEYVNADKDKLKKDTAATATTKNDPSKDASKPVPGPRLTKGLLKCSTSKTITDSSDYTLSEKNNLIEDTNIPSNVVTTGNPAQDMLDLFLGPLLKKSPPVKEPAIESVEEVCNSSLVETNEKAVYREEKNPVEERETLVKKRSSLKDKVAMFLS
ncbi:hypothetical protein FCM35_KLT06600 [Carex littledalei]|uniref:Uncharacterized protein n=1 Tax=Carex littledalei TaxID=544730 RepID=A0A833R135_9POAL|nr:hypothetical protein FCM35_KLT06600 [Carex littledalei]